MFFLFVLFLLSTTTDLPAHFTLLWPNFDSNYCRTVSTLSVRQADRRAKLQSDMHTNKDNRQTDNVTGTAHLIPKQFQNEKSLNGLWASLNSYGGKEITQIIIAKRKWREREKERKRERERERERERDWRDRQTNRDRKRDRERDRERKREREERQRDRERDREREREREKERSREREIEREREKERERERERERVCVCVRERTA